MAERGGMLKELFLKNWGLKILAVLLAMLSFYAIGNVTSEEKTFQIPVVAQLPAGVAVHAQNPTTVNVTFRGSEENIRQLDETKILATVKLKGEEQEGTHNITLKPRDIDGASHVRVVNIQPNAVELTLDTEAEKEVAVTEPQIDGTPLLGSVTIEYEPQIVTVRGPSRRLKDETFVSVSTERIDVEGRVASFSRLTKVLRPHEWVSSIEPAEVLVKVSVVTESVIREWTNVAVRVIVEPDCKKSFLLQPDVVNISLVGSSEILKNMGDDAVRVFVDCVGIDASVNYELPVEVHLPAQGDLNARADPEVINVTASSTRPESKTVDDEKKSAEAPVDE